MTPQPIVALPALDPVTPRPRSHLVIAFQALDFLCLCSADEIISQLGAHNADTVQEARLLTDLETNPIVIVPEVFDGDRPHLTFDADPQGCAVQVVGKALIHAPIYIAAIVFKTAGQIYLLTIR